MGTVVEENDDKHNKYLYRRDIFRSIYSILPNKNIYISQFTRFIL